MRERKRKGKKETTKHAKVNEKKTESKKGSIVLSFQSQFCYIHTHKKRRLDKPIYGIRKSESMHI